MRSTALLSRSRSWLMTIDGVRDSARDSPPARACLRDRGSWSARRAAAGRARQNSTAASATRMRQPPENSRAGRAAAPPASKPRPGEDRGGARRARHARRCRRAGSGCRRCGAGRWRVSASRQERGALGIGREHDVDQAARGRPAPPARRRPMRARLRHADRSPPSGAISPAMARNSVVLPAPLRPTRPTRAPAGICAEAPSNRRRPAMRSDEVVDGEHGAGCDPDPSGEIQVRRTGLALFERHGGRERVSAGRQRRRRTG